MNETLPSNHYIVCGGGGEVARHVVAEMILTRRRCVLLDLSAEQAERMKEADTLTWMQVDPAHEENLLRAGVQQARGLISVLRQDKDNLLCIVTARQLNPTLHLVSRCVDKRNADKLKRAGADAVVTDSLIGAHRMVGEMLNPAVLGFMDTLLRDEEGYRLEEVRIPPGHALAGKNLQEAKLHEIADVHLVAARDETGASYIYNPHVGLILGESMDVVFIATPAEARKLREHLQT